MSRQKRKQTHAVCHLDDVCCVDILVFLCSRPLILFHSFFPYLPPVIDIYIIYSFKHFITEKFVCDDDLLTGKCIDCVMKIKFFTKQKCFFHQFKNWIATCKLPKKNRNCFRPRHVNSQKLNSVTVRFSFLKNEVKSENPKTP